jgi:hypothetical protein
MILNGKIKLKTNIRPSMGETVLIYWKQNETLFRNPVIKHRDKS